MALKKVQTKIHFSQKLVNSTTIIFYLCIQEGYKGYSQRLLFHFYCYHVGLCILYIRY